MSHQGWKFRRMAGVTAGLSGAMTAANLHGEIAAVGGHSGLAAESLIQIVGALLVVVLAAVAWGWTMRVRAKRQAAIVTAHAETLAKQVRFNVELETKRSQILEDINSSRPLAELLYAISEMVA